MLVDASMLFALPDAVDDRAGTLVEPLAVAVRAVAKAELTPDEPVAVLGAGPIGLLTGLVLRERGARRFVIVSRNLARAERAAALGLPTATLEEVERDGLDERLGGSHPLTDRFLPHLVGDGEVRGAVAVQPAGDRAVVHQRAGQQEKGNRK
jgi:threonine dehydrogenase-like Zn-dependent dehydrogenase